MKTLSNKTNNKRTQFTEARLTVNFIPSNHPTKILEREDAENFLRSVWDDELIALQEQLYVLFLNQANEVICWRCLHTGTITSSLIDVRILFGLALGCCAVGFILAHNHPSGKLKPSQADLAITKKVKDAGELLDIVLLDHFIVAPKGSISFREMQLL